MSKIESFIAVFGPAIVGVIFMAIFSLMVYHFGPGREDTRKAFIKRVKLAATMATHRAVVAVPLVIIAGAMIVTGLLWKAKSQAKVKGGSSSSILLTWESKNVGGLRPTAFKIYYGIQGSVTNTVLENPEKTNTLIRGLESGSYFVTIASIVDGIEIQPKEVVTFDVRPSGGSGRIKNVKVTQVHEFESIILKVPLGLTNGGNGHSK